MSLIELSNMIEEVLSKWDVDHPIDCEDEDSPAHDHRECIDQDDEDFRDQLLRLRWKVDDLIIEVNDLHSIDQLGNCQECGTDPRECLECSSDRTVVHPCPTIRLLIPSEN